MENFTKIESEFSGYNAEEAENKVHELEAQGFPAWYRSEYASEMGSVGEHFQGFYVLHVSNAKLNPQECREPVVLCTSTWGEDGEYFTEVIEPCGEPATHKVAWSQKDIDEGEWGPCCEKHAIRSIEEYGAVAQELN